MPPAPTSRELAPRGQATSVAARDSLAAPARQRRRYLRWLAWAAFAVLVAVGGHWGFWRYHAKRFQEVRSGVFYRVAQPTEFGLAYIVKQYGIKTVLSVQLYDFRLHKGLFDPGRPDGGRETEHTAQLGVRHLQWPMGEESYWPWLTPWQFDQFFKLVDNPDNLPLAVHCMGGRHRTGTLSALFRLEYDRWTPDQALAEMYDFDFGPPVTLQEHNLRTYSPRPRPSASEWAALDVAASKAGCSGGDYSQLVERLRAQRRSPLVARGLAAYIDGNQPFALQLAQRLIDDPSDHLAPHATRRAHECLKSLSASPAQWWAAAALVADFGDPEHQRELLVLLGDHAYRAASGERFDSVVAGVTNRFTPNRRAYLVPLLEIEDFHRNESCRQYRYCDTAVSRLCVITDENLLSAAPPGEFQPWQHGREAARAWFARHTKATMPSPLRPPTGRTRVRAGNPPDEEQEPGSVDRGP